MMFYCQTCSKTFGNSVDAADHRIASGHPVSTEPSTDEKIFYRCTQCHLTNLRGDEASYHTQQTGHWTELIPAEVYNCKDCSLSFKNREEAGNHVTSQGHTVGTLNPTNIKIRRAKEIDYGTASSSQQPRWDLLPRRALLRLIKRFELGEERKTICTLCNRSIADVPKDSPCLDPTDGSKGHKWVNRAWNARTDQSCLDNKEFVISRVVHVINHAYALLDKLDGKIPWDTDDDAAAIGFGAIFLSEATEKYINSVNELVPGRFAPSVDVSLAERCTWYRDANRCELTDGHSGPHSYKVVNFVRCLVGMCVLEMGHSGEHRSGLL